jgi:magnesium chelatase subunit D
VNLIFPFTAITGQDELKLCLILNAVNPDTGGVLIRGEKGTAKSTAVRSMAELLPGADVITLPLNATEDRIAGGIDFNRAVKEGRKIFMPGLLHRAHKGILYVDEINLLDDHIIDIILDAAAGGANRVEREGISFCHRAEFMLVGTMNPEEGGLRPQLLDRFGLCVEVVSRKDPDDRVRLMEQRELFDSDPAAFRAGFEAETAHLAARIAAAGKLLPEVKITKQLRCFIAELCSRNNVAGHRADLVIEQAARAHAAFEGRCNPEIKDVQAVAKFALVHRKRESDQSPPSSGGGTPPSLNSEGNTQNHDTGKGNSHGDTGFSEPESGMESGRKEESSGKEDTRDSIGFSLPEPSRDGNEQVFETGAAFSVKKIFSARDRKIRKGSGRRSITRVWSKHGRYVRTGPFLGNNDIAFDATLRAAAPHQKTRQIPEGMAISLEPSDIKGKIRERKTANFLVFVVDASGSMGARGRMTAAKGAVLSLLLDAYQKRDRVAMISFRKTEAVVNLAPTSSIELAAELLSQMPVGGRTPLSAGLDRAYQMVRTMLVCDPGIRPIVIIITDGKANVSMGSARPVDEAMTFASRMGMDERVSYVVVDTEDTGITCFGLAEKLAEAAGARYFKMEDLRADSLVSLVKDLW